MKHLIVRIEDTPGTATEYHALCGQVGVRKSDYVFDWNKTTCPECLASRNEPRSDDAKTENV